MKSKSISPSGQITQHAYDSRRRRVSTTDALNRAWRFVYNDAAGPSGPAPCCGADPTSNTRAAEVIHPDGSREQKTYNVAGQLIATTDAKGDTVKYAYDAAGRLSELTDANGHSTKWRYDARGKLAAKTYPDNTTELYEHDAAGQLVSRVRPDGVSAHHTYDLRGRLLSIEWSDGKTENSTFAYDKAGHLTLAQNKSATVKRSYHKTGRLAQETQQISRPVAVHLDKPFTAAIGYAYDPDGRLAQLTYPDQSTVSYRYNERGELREVQDSSLSALGSKRGAAAYTRRPDGKITQLTLPNGTVTTKAYDAVGRLSEIKHVDPAGNTLFSETSRYDLKSRRTARVQADGSADLFAYDPAGQVTAAVYGQAGSTAVPDNLKPQTLNFEPSQTFEYDPAGNRLEATDHGTTTKYTPNAANQYTAVVTGTQIVEPQFDKLGNLLRDDKNTYTWDADIHLLSVTSSGGIPVPGTKADKTGDRNVPATTRFAYDPLHRRVARHEAATNTTTFFVADGWNVIEEYSVSPSLPLSKSPSLRLTWGEDLSGSLQGAGGIGGLLASKTANSEPRTANWFAYDSNGNVICLTDAQGQESARYRYDAFGKTILAQGPAAQTNRYRFSTKPVEEGSGLAYYGYRYYSPELGRWPSKDPLQENGGLNSYSIAFNDTINKLDYYGLICPNKGCTQQDVNNAVNDPAAQEILSAIINHGYRRPNFECKPCANPDWGGYAQNGDVVICSTGPARGRDSLIDYVRHELVHTLDRCHGEDGSCDDAICTEIRAYILMNPDNNSKQTVKDRARRSVEHRADCLASYETAFEALWPACKGSADEDFPYIYSNLNEGNE